MSKLRTSEKHFGTTQQCTPSQVIDTGMAMTLLALIAFLFDNNRYFLYIALGLLVVNMTVPMAFLFVAKIWLWFSRVLGTIVSMAVLTVIFFGVITPVGFVKRLFGSEPLRIKQWRDDASSLFQDRNHPYAADDVHHPF